MLAAVDWHISQGYGGEEFLFSKSSAFPRYIDSHVRPLKLVQEELGLRLLSHHKVGGTRSRAKPSLAASRSRRCRPSSAIGPSKARTSMRTWALGPRNG